MARENVEMPKMGESITEGTVIAWHKQPGDEVEMDETLLEIGTDKVDTEVPSPAGGVLQEHLVEEGETVAVGTAIAVIETEPEAAGEGGGAPADEGEGQAAEAPAQAEAPAAEEAEEAAADQAEPATQAEPTAPEETEASASASGEGGETIEVVMPKMGESITEGTVIAWHKQPGDGVEMDETLLEIGTDKVDTEVPSPAGGVLREHLVGEGETVAVGTPIAIIATGEPAEADAPSEGAAPAEERPEAEPSTAPSGDGAQAPAETDVAGEPEAAPAPSGDGTTRQPEPAGGAPAEGEAIQRRGESGRFYSPLVRSIAQEEGLSMQELEQIEGSGREGRVTKEDVMAYLEERPGESAEEHPARAPGAAAAEDRAAQARPPMPGDAGGYDGRVEIMEMDRMRQITAEHMIRSKQTSAHVTSFAEADVTGLVKLRENNKEAFLEREGVKLTFTPFFVQAAIQALRDHPVVNASVDGKQIVLKKDYHIGIAVAIGKKGLMAPVIRHADEKNLVGLARAAGNLAERARSKQLQPDELQGGTFTVTNIGSLGSIMGTPIINQPQVGILATGAIKKRPVVIEDPELGDIIAVRHMMYACLSYDHRVIDGAMGASFLQRFTDALEAYSADDEI